MSSIDGIVPNRYKNEIFGLTKTIPLDSKNYFGGAVGI